MVTAQVTRKSFQDQWNQFQQGLNQLKSSEVKVTKADVSEIEEVGKSLALKLGREIRVQPKRGSDVTAAALKQLSSLEATLLQLTSTKQKQFDILQKGALAPQSAAALKKLGSDGFYFVTRDQGSEAAKKCWKSMLRKLPQETLKDPEARKLVIGITKEHQLTTEELFSSQQGVFPWRGLDTEQFEDLLNGVDFRAFSLEMKNDFLLASSEQGSAATVAELIRLGANKKCSESSHRNTPLHLAAMKGHDGVLEVLLKDALDEARAPCIKRFINKVLRFFGFKAEIETNFWLTNSSLERPLDKAAFEGCVSSVKLMLEAGAKADAKALYHASINGHIPVMEELLSKRLDINEHFNLKGTALHAAAINGKLEAVRFLLSQGIDPDKKTRAYQGNTPLYEAAKNNHRDVVKALVATGKVDLNKTNQDQMTALEIAIVQGNVGVVEELLNTEGIQINGNGGRNSTPLDLAITRQGIDVKIVELLVLKGAARKNGSFENTLEFLASKGCLQTLEKLHDQGKITFEGDQKALLKNAVISGNRALVGKFIAWGANVNQQDPEGYTPLLRAIEKGDELMAIQLLMKSDVSIANNHQVTPLHMAALKGKVGLVDALLSRQANIEAKNQSGETPFLVAVYSGQLAVMKALIEANAKTDVVNSSGYAAIHLAVTRGYTEIVKELATTQNLKLKVKVGYKEASVLHLANTSEMVTLLLDKGADVNAKNIRGETPLHTTYLPTILATLLKAKDADLNAKDSCGDTPLHKAIKSAGDNGLERVRHLFSAGASPNLRNSKGNTPLEIAAKKMKLDPNRKYSEIVDALAAGQDIPWLEELKRGGLENSLMQKEEIDWVKGLIETEPKEDIIEALIVDPEGEEPPKEYAIGWVLANRRGFKDDDLDDLKKSLDDYKNQQQKNKQRRAMLHMVENMPFGGYNPIFGLGGFQPGGYGFRDVY